MGEVPNLYKTTKPAAMRRRSSNQTRCDDNIMIDLHGLTKEDVLNIAMKGSYPWVIPVKIVRGGGSQMLVKTVENWIKQNENVLNAPKNLYTFNNLPSRMQLWNESCARTFI